MSRLIALAILTALAIGCGQAGKPVFAADVKAEKEGKDWDEKRLGEYLAKALDGKGYTCKVGVKGNRVEVAKKANKVELLVDKELTPELAAKRATIGSRMSWGLFVVSASTSFGDTKEDRAFYQSVISDIKTIIK